jgi:hypothetical protein
VFSEIGILYEKEGEQFHPDRAITRQEAKHGIT